MNDKQKVFLDTNLLIYAHTNVDVRKQQIIQSIIADENTVISTQVLKEVASVLFRKFKFPWPVIGGVLQEMELNNEVHNNSPVTIQSACQIADRYRFSFYDSLIIAAASESGCAILFSEDVQHGQVVEQSLIIKNPFA